MNRKELVSQIEIKKSFLCVGLDVDINKIPAHLLNTDDPIFAFNKAIIDATASYCVAYKPNLAFYEAYGVKGLIAFDKTVKYMVTLPLINLTAGSTCQKSTALNFTTSFLFGAAPTIS